jgi:branched-chain amino acid transport system ATP-binding protein
MAARAGTDGRRDWTLERVIASFPRLAERIHNQGNQLSGGEQQMLTIGRALLTNPDALILDEATEGLAPMISREIWRSCAKSGIGNRGGHRGQEFQRGVGNLRPRADPGQGLDRLRPCAELRSQPEVHQRYLGV